MRRCRRSDRRGDVALTVPCRRFASATTARGSSEGPSSGKSADADTAGITRFVKVVCKLGFELRAQVSALQP